MLLGGCRKLQRVYEREWEDHAAILQRAMTQFEAEPERLDVPPAFAPLDLTRAAAAMAAMPSTPTRVDKDNALQDVGFTARERVCVYVFLCLCVCVHFCTCVRVRARFHARLAGSHLSPPPPFSPGHSKQNTNRHLI